MSESTQSELLFNPFDAAFRADPYPFYERLRREEPVHATPFGMIVLSRYADVALTLRSNDFSRDIDARANPSADPVVRARDERLRERFEQQGRAKTILNLDPPDHTRLRRLVSQAFTPSAIERLRPRVQELVDGILDTAEADGGFELVDALAFPVPFQVISELLAMPTDRAAELREWSQRLTASLEPTATDEDFEAGREAIELLRPYLIDVITARRRNLGDDLLSALISVEEGGERLSTEELISFVTLLYVAGHETTVNLIGNATLALLRNPAQLAMLRADPAMMAPAVDELLRYDGPVQLTVRVPIAPVTYDTPNGPFTVEPGVVVMTVLGAANHDPAVFDEPDTLRVDRPNANRHVAFAAGIHYCLGASLARLEAEVAVGTLIRRFSVIELDGEPTWRDRLTIRGVDHLPLALSP